MRLILPVSGQSSRFPGMRPKWMLTHPNGNMMIAESFLGLEPESFSEIIVIGLKIHNEHFQIETALKKQFEKIGLLQKLKIVLIDESHSQPHTVYQYLVKENITGPILIKDSDNTFKCKPTAENYVCYLSISEVKRINAANKSYIQLSENNHIENIVEKQVVSDTFCVGGYGFAEASEFIRCYEEIQDKSDLYISHIIYQMILSKVLFKGKKVSDFLDWGTLQDWNNFRSRFSTLFLDLDGTLVHNSAEYFAPFWGETEPIQENIDIINKLYNSGYAKIIITTARGESHKEITEKQLKRIGLQYHQIIFGLDHSKRIIVNDYSKSNPYKSCESINLKRNSSDLVEMLEDALTLDEF